MDGEASLIDWTGELLELPKEAAAALLDGGARRVWVGDENHT